MTTSDLTPLPLGARNATLSDLARLLREQQARKVDIVAPATAIRAHAAQLVVDDSVPELGPDGVTATAGAYTPTEVCDQGSRTNSASPPHTCGGCASANQAYTTRTSTAGWTVMTAGSCCAACTRHGAG